VKLRDLLPAGGGWRLDGDSAVEITGLSYDSRKTAAGDLFFSMARDPAANRANVEDALNHGARAVVVKMRGWVANARPVVIVESERPRVLMATAASRFFSAPSERLDLIGVTGTSGKTTSTYLLASIFNAAGHRAGIIGTIGTFIDGRRLYSGLTTPEAIDFEAALAEMERAHVPRVAAEISSIGIAEGRVEALNFRACLFTNLGRDHLDYHGTIEDYFAAKLRLFTELLPRSGRVDPIAVVCGDDPWGRRILDAVSVHKLSFGLDRSRDVHAVKYRTGIDGIRATISALGRQFEVESPLLGEINLFNILGVVAVSAALGIGGEAVADGVRRCPGAPGRLEAVPGPPGVKVLVDYAHKPDALEGVLKALRALGPRRILCVFGCGGDRDRGKRPLMGGIAGRLSDLPILTSDNPRTEDPLGIIAEVEAGLAGCGLRRLDRAAAGGVKGYLVEPDRRAAIAMALSLAAAGDMILIAGKGHEDYQLVGDRRLKFDDRAVVREIVAGA
jgi:UDP-N-acetylmuramoyl-L-alanyl-D-glutamate--2,6-diaminopimelate ligase